MQSLAPKRPENAWLLPVLAAVITAAAFLPAVTGGFVNWDDAKNFLHNPNYRGLGLAQIAWMWTTPHMGHYVPITWMTLGLDYNIWGMEPFGYHAANLLWHCANAALVYFLALALFRIRGLDGAAGQFGALAAALFFGVHPLRVESVAWITERRDVVSGFFCLLAVLLYLRHAREQQRKYYWACLGCFVLAVLSKEIAVTLPLVLVLLDIYPLARLRAKNVWVEKIPFFLIAAADGVLALYAGRAAGVTASLSALGIAQRLVIGVYSLAFYLWKTLLPVNLAAFYALTPHRMDPRALPFLASVAVVMAGALAAIVLRRRLPAVLAAAAAYAITLLPVSGLFHNGLQITADRYSYLSCIGWAIAAGAGAAMLWNHRRLVVPLVAVAVIACSVLTWRQSETWHDSETLWTHALAVEPSFMAYTNLGQVLQDRGDDAGAVENYRQALQLNPGFDVTHNNLGGALLQLGAWDEAIGEFRTALELNPALSSAHNGWGYALVRQGRLEEAIPHFQQALRIDPGLEAASINLHAALRRRNAN